MATTLQEYKCPCCGGAINFDTSIQKMKCPYCDTEFEMDVLAQYDSELSTDGQDDINWFKDEIPAFEAGEEEGMHVFVCKSCGGQIVGDDTMAAKDCPYCGNPIVVMGNVAGQLKPEYIIPFKLDKEAAKAKLKEHYKGKIFLPKEFKTENHIDEMKGLYVPFWIFDSKTKGHLRFRGVKVRHFEDREYRYTEESYFAILRGGTLNFEHVPVDGASKIPDDLTESLEPYDFREAVPFQTAYFAGFMADKYDVDSDKSIEIANNRVRKSTEIEFQKTIHGFDRVTPEGGNISIKEGKTSYVMYPVWLLNTTWRGEKYTFAMNGQTGKFVGNLPCDKSIATKWLLGLTVIATAVVFGIRALMWFL